MEVKLKDKQIKVFNIELTKREAKNVSEGINDAINAYGNVNDDAKKLKVAIDDWLK